MGSCGLIGYCGRPDGHRGHHGGWVTRVAGVADNPVTHITRTNDRLGQSLSPAMARFVAEYVVHGSYKEAGACMGYAEQTLKNIGTQILARTGAVSIGQVPYVLGWVTIPPGFMHREAV